MTLQKKSLKQNDETFRKYFHKAICQSGVSLNDWVLQVGPIEKARKLSKLLGCQDILDDQMVYKTLIDAPASEFVRLANHTVTEDEKRRSLVMPFRPVVEGSHNHDAFIIDHPLNILNKKDFLSGIPLISVSTILKKI